MSKKNLLNEATIRRFMKLANMEPLTSPFVDRLSENWGEKEDEYKRRDVDGVEKKAGDVGGHYKDYEMNEDEEEERELHATEDELGDEDHVADEEGAELDALEDEGADAPLDADVAARVEDALAGALEALAAELGDSLGVELDVESAPEEEEMEVDVAAELEPTDGGEELDIAVDAEEEPAPEEDLLEGVEVVDDTALINEVAKRVTARLVKAMAKK